ncbi:MAG: hypothetical protein WKF31_04885 [Thermoleophilaceae bacterium]
MIDYYTRVAPVLLPHLRDRALTLKRYPDGVEGPHFYEKECPRHRPDWVRTEAIALRSDDRRVNFCVVDELAALVWAANLADLELHTSLSLATDPGRPTMLAFDLDPGPPAAVIECARVAVALRDTLAQLSLPSFPKTSGSKGMQVYVPLDGRSTYEQTKPFARGVAEHLEKVAPRPRGLEHEEEPARRQGADRLEPERRAQDHGVRVLAPGPRAADGVHPARMGGGRGRARGRRRRRPLLRPRRTCSRGAPRRGDLFAPVVERGPALPDALRISVSRGEPPAIRAGGPARRSPGRRA